MKWFLLLPVWAVFNFLARILPPLLPIFATLQIGKVDNNNSVGLGTRLPSWLSWFMTPDNSLEGDATFERLNPPCYLSRVKWLWRNPAYGFERSVLAASIRSTDVPEVSGDPRIRDGADGKPGYCFTRIGQYWNLVWIKRLYGSSCLYWNLGWNLKTYAEVPSRLNSEPMAQYVCSPRFSTIPL